MRPGTEAAVGDRLTLVPRTNKGRNRIREAGVSVWQVCRIQQHVLFSAEDGPWLLIEPMTGERKAGDLGRWIHGARDKDFLIWRVDPCDTASTPTTPT